MQMLEVVTYGLALAGYAAAFILAVLALVIKKPRTLAPAYVAAVAGTAALTVSLASRGFGFGAPPFITYYESVSFGSWLAMAGLLYFSLRRKELRAVLAVLCPVLLLLMGSAMFTHREFEKLSPALQSWWLVVHILFAMLSFASMAVAFGAAVILVFFPRAKWSPSAKLADSVISKSIILAFIFQMVMLVSGSIWGNQAWGRYWGWDPIETFSLLTLILFGIAIHLQVQFGWKGKRMAWLAIIGFLCTVYGIWGVPFFSQSLHLYQGPAGFVKAAKQ